MTAPASSGKPRSHLRFVPTQSGGKDRPPSSPHSSPPPRGSATAQVSAKQKPKLLDQVRAAIRMRHYSLRTEKAYVHWIKRFIFFHKKRHPAEMGEAEIGQFLSSLASEQQVSASTQNQALNALLFLYREVLEKPIGYINGVVRARKPARLPVVLTRQEVRAIFGFLNGPEWLMAMLLYGAGLRLMECLRLRVKDIDFLSNHIVVRGGKGDKDRITMLPAAVQEPLRRHLEHVKAQYQQDVENGRGGASLPNALERKCPNAAKEWGWQFVSRLQGSPRTLALARSVGIICMKPCCKR